MDCYVECSRIRAPTSEHDEGDVMTSCRGSSAAHI